MTKFFHFCTKTALASTVAAIALSLAAFLAIVFFLWRVSVQPVDINFIKPTIEKALSRIDPRYSLAVGSVVVHWPGLTGPVLLRVEDLDILEGQKTSALNISKAVVGVSRSALLLGQIKPQSIIVEGPALQIIRKEDGVYLSFDGQEISSSREEAQEEVQDRDQEGESEVEYTDPYSVRRQIAESLEILSNGSASGDSEGIISFLSNLQMFEVRDAQLAVRDFVSGASWYLQDFDFAFERHAKDLRVDFSVKIPGGKSENSGFSVHLESAYDTGSVIAQMDLRDMNPLFFSRFVDFGVPLAGNHVILNGEVSASLNAGLELIKANLALDSKRGKIAIPQEYDQPLSYEDLRIEVSCTSCRELVEVKTIEARVETIPLKLSAKLHLHEDMLSLPLTITSPSIPLGSIAPLYPKSEIDGEAAKWLLHQLTGGRFYDIKTGMTVIAQRAEVPVTADEPSAVDDIEDKVKGEAVPSTESKWHFDVRDPRIDFFFEDVDVDYGEGLMPAKSSKGKGFFDFDRLVVEGEKAVIGETVTASDILLTFTDIMVVGGGFADITMHVDGPLPTILQYTASEPIGFGDTLGFDLGKVEGAVSADLHITLPTVANMDKDDVKVAITGTADKTKLPAVVNGLDFTGGPLSVDVKDGAFTVKGKGFLAGRSISLTWKQFFDPAGEAYESQVQAKLKADQKMRHHFGVELDEYISGSMPIDLVYTEYVDNTQNLDFKGDLAPMQITLEPFAYEKPPGVPGKVTFQGNLKGSILETITDLELTTENFTLSGASLAFETFEQGAGKEKEQKTELRSGELGLATIGKTVTQADFEISRENVLKVAAQASIFDAEPFLRQQERKGPIEKVGDALYKPVQPLIVSLKTPKMLTKESRSVRDVQLYVSIDETDTVTQIEMDALAGKGDIYMRYKPGESGRKVFRLEASDAGATLHAFDIYSDMRGGRLLVYGEPIPGTGDRDLEGVARIDEFVVVNAPALARLVSAMSLTGLDELLNQEGLAFSKFESKFKWRSRPQGAIIGIQDGRTSGSSLGLTLEGTMDKSNSTMDLQGTIVPMSEINTFLSNIPLIGDLLTGGSGGGIIAATYTMKGDSKEPSVLINPLSVLTPGFLRTILFEGGYDEPIPDNEYKEEQ